LIFFDPQIWRPRISSMHAEAIYASIFRLKEQPMIVFSPLIDGQTAWEPINFLLTLHLVRKGLIAYFLG
jgi:hypothetical protein